MIDFHSKKTQKYLLRTYYVSSFLMLVFPMFIFDVLEVSDLFKNTYNFIGKIDPSGLLIFAGVASGITYLNRALIPYRNIAFVCGFFFALAQAAIAGMEPLSSTWFEPNFIQSLLLSSVFIGGIGFFVFSLLAMAVAEYDRENHHADVTNDSSKKNNNSGESVNLSLSSKNDSAQLSPAPSDLAHDLRYSRSRARRSRAQR